LSVLSKTISIQRGQTNIALMTIGGARIVHSKHKHHHCPFSYTPIQTSNGGNLQMRCLVKWDRCCEKQL